MNPVSSCPICFDTLSDKIKASPDNCEHIFCLPCLEKWSKTGSYCPVDRKRFKKIQNLETDSLIQIKPHKRKRKRIVYDFSTSCEVCSGSTNANVLLLCDCCDLGYHTFCLKPPLKEVPAGLWYCPTCISVEEKMKKKNGITKEVEAELGSFDSSDIKEKITDEKKSDEEKSDEEKSVTNSKKLDAPAPSTKNSNTLQTCYDIISEFEDMSVKKSSAKGASSSNCLDSTVNRLDKIYKTFDNKKPSLENSKHLKTYSVTNAYRKSKRVKPFDLDCEKSISESISVNPNNTSLDVGNTSSDIDLQNHSNEANNILPDKLLENAQRKNQRRKFPLETFDVPVKSNIEKRITRKSVENILLSEKNIKDDIEKPLKKKEVNRATIASYSEDPVPLSSRLRNKSSKGTSKNLIQFSVFQRIEGIDASQEICSQISSVEVPFSSNTRLQHCSMCHDEFFAKSELQCKLCKLKCFNTEESKRFSNYVKNLKKGLNNKKFENISWKELKCGYRALRSCKKMSNSAYVLERRKRSLMRTLKKIHDSKCINTINIK